MTTHELTQNAAGQSQPRDSHCHMTAANAMEHANAKQTLIHGQNIGQRLQRTPLTRLPPGHNSVHSQTISQTLHNPLNASRWPIWRAVRFKIIFSCRLSHVPFFYCNHCMISSFHPLAQLALWNIFANMVTNGSH